ncbi:TetR family transcriptional regulator C-terminal domain-containing protein [Actinacidiphila soli]|uniref:TetR family transcriptional regulator C-terminal domain-containing protein n=1 Tax=Actinacidiphila soli TaxID=2487275 RepID=UPI001F0C909D|nr:TetR family transcriptional regulator C-terminal domain-containing protein [Actinacidiphila soli]
MRALVERGHAEGDFTCDDSDDSDGFAVRFSALVDGLALQRLCQAPPLSTDDARRHLYRLVEVELER